MNQAEAVIITIERLGGIATLGQLYQEVFNEKNCEWKTKTPFASIRRIVQTKQNEIYKIKPGLYALTSHKKDLEQKGILEETEKNKDSQEMHEFNHSYYQGLLLKVGNIRNMKTFIPDQDKNKLFLHQKLGELKTLEHIPQYTYKELVHRSSTIDVIWFNERKMPSSFFEVEHSTDIQNSLLKFNDLQDFNVRMVIVADAKRKDEYIQKIHYSSFHDINKRVNFFSYDELVKQYEQEIERSKFSFKL
jgi:hypothetical protein